MKTIIYLLSIFLICLTLNKFTYGQNQNKLELTRTTTIYHADIRYDTKKAVYPAIDQLVECINHYYRLQQLQYYLLLLHINEATITPNMEYEIKVKIRLSGPDTFLGSIRFIATQDANSPTKNKNMPLLIFFLLDVPSYGGGVIWIELYDSSGNQLDSYDLNVWVDH